MSSKDKWMVVTNEDGVHLSDTAEHIAHVADYLETLGREWTKVREQFRNELPLELADALDAAAPDLAICCDDDCRNLCHRDWDFCKEHGPDDDTDAAS